jgi:uncharacterized protein
MHYLLFYEAGEEYVAKRAKFRSQHLAKARQAAERGELVLGGAYANPANGAVLLFRGDSPAVAEEFAKSDPYVTGGAVNRWYVREWTTVVGEQAEMPVAPEEVDGPAKTTDDQKDGPSGPILRLWKGRSIKDRGGDYVQHAAKNVLPQLGAIEGHKGAYLLRRSVGSGFEFLVLTLWESMEAVRRFAGPRPEKAVVEPAARAALTDFDRFATHYEVVIRTGPNE